MNVVQTGNSIDITSDNTRYIEVSKPQLNMLFFGVKEKGNGGNVIFSCT